MVRLRILLAWLLMAALPVQGFAAVSMLLCDSAGASHQHVAASAPAHEHMAHDGAHGDHADGHHHAQADPQAQPASSDPASGNDTGHRCATCGNSCHGVAIASAPVALKLSSAAPPETAEPVAPLTSRHTPVPDKPPRA